jgi:hypothetical protein
MGVAGLGNRLIAWLFGPASTDFSQLDEYALISPSSMLDIWIN